MIKSIIRRYRRFYINYRKSYVQTMNDIGWVLWFKHNETSGTSVANSGSLATTGTWNPGVGSVGQTGFLGANEAFDYDGANSRTSIPNNAIFGNATAFTWMILFKPDGNGEGGIGHLYRYGIVNTFAHVNNNSRLTVRRTAATTNAFSEALAAWSAGQWSHIFITFDNATDRLLHVYRAQNGNVSELTYNTNSHVAAVGALTNNTDTLFIGNASNLTVTFDGLIDEIAYKNAVLTLSQMRDIARGLNVV